MPSPLETSKAELTATCTQHSTIFSDPQRLQMMNIASYAQHHSLTALMASLRSTQHSTTDRAAVLPEAAFTNPRSSEPTLSKNLALEE